MNALPALVLSEMDFSRIERVLEAMPPVQRQSHARLQFELARAEIVTANDVPPDVVTMNSRVGIEVNGVAREVTLVYPDNAVPDGLSVLAAAGSAILGLRVGDEIRWPTAHSGWIHVCVTELPFQPERSGDLTCLRKQN
jgi:regulator of nucleoside diphosphate kinase